MVLLRFVKETIERRKLKILMNLVLKFLYLNKMICKN